MKKITMVALVFLSIIILSGCTTNTEPVSEELQASDNTSGQASEASSSEYIGENSAKAIALEHSGLSEADVTFIKVELDYDNGSTVYDIEFFYNNTEYDYEIDAYTGNIYSFDNDIENYSYDSAQLSDGNYISVDEAKSIALEELGLSESDVSFKQAHLEYDDGRAIYIIEFISGDMDYDFEIDATSGSIIEFDKESIYD